MIRNVLGLTLGFVLGLVLTAPITAYAQSTTALIRQSDFLAPEVECTAQIPLKYQVDSGPEVDAVGLTWSASTGGVKTGVPYPNDAVARTPGMHTFKIINPGTTITLTNGQPYTIPPGSVTLQVQVFPDVAQGNPPKFLRWITTAFQAIAKALGKLMSWHA